MLRLGFHHDNRHGYNHSTKLNSTFHCHSASRNPLIILLSMLSFLLHSTGWPGHCNNAHLLLCGQKFSSRHFELATRLWVKKQIQSFLCKYCTFKSKPRLSAIFSVFYMDSFLLAISAWLMDGSTRCRAPWDTPTCWRGNTTSPGRWWTIDHRCSICSRVLWDIQATTRTFSVNLIPP